MDRDSLQRFLEQGLSLEQIGARVKRHPSTVGYWLRKYGLMAVNGQRNTPRGALDRTELETLVAGGASVSAIAAQLDASATRVQYWLRNYGLRTRHSLRRAKALQARKGGVAVIRLMCPHHGLTDFWLEGRGYHRCLRCRGEAVARRRRKVKAVLVEELGGRCRICGYDRCVGALHFHHVDPATKAFTVSHQGATLALERMREEVRKCVLLCANCHAEVEAGIAKLELQS
jgi:transposase